MNEHITGTFYKIKELRDKLQTLDYQYWLDQSLFSWEWWLLICMTVIPLFVWWNTVDRSRVYEIAFFGCLINIMAVLLDDLGTNLTWWGYPIRLIPFMPPLITADSVLVPIAFMFVYQFFSETKSAFIAATLIMAGFIAFVAEPIFIWLGYYHLYDWRVYYSFCFYIVAVLLARFIVVKIIK